MTAQDPVNPDYSAWQASIAEYHCVTKQQIDEMVPIDKDIPIVVMQEADGVTFSIDGKHFRVDQEETNELLVEMFKYLGFKNVSFEECY
jgi:hypothetical protein